jgi:hypothetical protein
MTAITTPHLFGLLALIAFWLVPTLVVMRIAARKGRDKWVYFAASLLIGWPLPLIAALVVRPETPTLATSTGEET